MRLRTGRIHLRAPLRCSLLLRLVRAHRGATLVALAIAMGALVICEIQRLDARTRPGRFTQKLETRLETRVVLKTANLDAVCKHRPAVPFNEVLQDALERDPMQGIVWLFLTHDVL